MQPAGEKGGIGIRNEKQRTTFLKKQLVGAKYPLAYEDPGFLASARTRANAILDDALVRNSVDESTAPLFVESVVGEALEKTLASFKEQAAFNVEILDAMAVAEAEQLSWLQTMKQSYTRQTSIDDDNEKRVQGNA